MREDIEKIKEIKKMLLHVSGDKYLELDAPRYYPNPAAKLEELIKKSLSGEEVTILWNVQPWDNFNILHGIYCQKLKECIDSGFYVVVLLYDKLIEKLVEKIYGSPIDPNYVKGNVEKNIEWFRRAGLDDERTEFLTESILWEIIDARHFMETITSLAHLCKADIGRVQINKEDLVSFIFGNLCEIYYENILKCDILLTGSIDIQRIWNLLRSEMVRKSEKYDPPVLISFPTLLGTDGRPLTTRSDENSLSIKHKIKELEHRVKKCSIDFLETLFDFLIIPYEGKVIEINGKTFTKFQQLKEQIQEENKIRNKAFEFVKEYFKKIKGV